MSRHWILDGHEPVSVSIEEWGRWFEGGDRIVRQDRIAGPDEVLVSTVFIGIDLGVGGESPELFETMVFRGDHDGETRRYATWDEAEAGHYETIAAIVYEMEQP